MATNKEDNDLKKTHVDEEYLMQVISGDEPSTIKPVHQQKEFANQKVKEKAKNNTVRKVNYEDTFLINRLPSGRNGKVVYIRPEYHERLLRIVQLTREEKTTLYSYIDNILEQHFLEYGNEITEYFNNHFKPIL